MLAELPEGVTPLVCSFVTRGRARPPYRPARAVNTWDDQIVSWGMAQFAGHAGSLAGLLIFLKERTPAAFAKFFVAAGIDVDHGPYPCFDRKERREITRTGAHVEIAAGGKEGGRGRSRREAGARGHAARGRALARSSCAPSEARE